MSQPPTQSLPDLTRALRVHRWLFAAVVLTAVIAAAAYSLTQEKVYTSEAKIAFADQAIELGAVGIALPASQTAAERAASNAETVVGFEVLSRVRKALDSPLSVSELAANVTATVDPDSTLVNIGGEGATAAEAQTLADTVAIEGTDYVNEEARETFAEQAKELRRSLPSESDDSARIGIEEDISRLLTLSEIASPAEIAAPARRPESPTSPKPVRNTILGGLLGLILGLIAVFVRDTFDRRLRRASEIEAELDINLLGCVGNDVLGRSARPGGDSHVTGPDWELFRILRRMLDFISKHPTRLVAVTSSVPEEGKTTVASFLAFASAAAGDRTLLIECDLRRPALADRLELNRSPGVADFVAETATPAEVVQTITFSYLPGSVPSGGNGLSPGEPTAEHSHHIACITAGTSLRDPVEIFRSPRFKEMLATVREAYDLVILDTPPMLVVVDPLELLPEADAIVMCVRASQATRDQVRAGREALNQLPERPTGLVVTGVAAGSEPGYEHYGYY